ncbi:hypothetical protein C9J98_17430 [Stenotrophomonas panacihumi]|nr:hypothetical protein C9J98_17430 [Stenotrophomonas panacihumi]
MVVVGGLWFFVPFAIFGIKPLLQQLIAEQHATRAMLTAMATPAQRELAAEFLTPEPKPKLLERLRGK